MYLKNNDPSIKQKKNISKVECLKIKNSIIIIKVSVSNFINWTLIDNQNLFNVSSEHLLFLYFEICMYCL